MYKKTFSFLLLTLCMIAVLPSSASASVHPQKPTGKAQRVPDLLTPYERRVLRIELSKLMSEIRTAREKAAADASLESKKAELAKAKLSGDISAIARINNEISDAAETILYKDEAIVAKIKRMQEVGALLEADSRKRKEQRANLPPPQQPAPPPQPSA